MEFDIKNRAMLTIKSWKRVKKWKGQNYQTGKNQKLIFDTTEQSYMHNPESILENEA